MLAHEEQVHHTRFSTDQQFIYRMCRKQTACSRASMMLKHLGVVVVMPLHRIGPVIRQLRIEPLVQGTHQRRIAPLSCLVASA